MSIDKLQQKIRKLKNPSIIDLTPDLEDLPPCLKEAEGSSLQALDRFCTLLLENLKGIVPGVRFQMGRFALQGPQGLDLLQKLMRTAQKLDYYVLLDVPESLSAQSAQTSAAALAGWPCDGIVISAYIGSDGIKPYIPVLEQNGKSLFVVLRTANKSASELQDLMTGSRLVHMAATEMVSRLGEPLVGRCGYAQIAGVGAANAAESLRRLRNKHSRLFLMVDGYDYSNANAKNCSEAFDQFGHGAVVCAGSSITGAWKEMPDQGSDFAAHAVEAAKRMQKNLLRYITVL